MTLPAISIQRMGYAVSFYKMITPTFVTSQSPLQSPRLKIFRTLKILMIYGKTKFKTKQKNAQRSDKERAITIDKNFI